MYMKESIEMDKDVVTEDIIKQMVPLFMVVDGLIMKLLNKIVIVS